jgi:PQQ-dependent catabolism-associated CXXCW motif protein
MAPAAAVNEPADYWTGEAGAPVPAGVHGGQVVHAKTVASLLRQDGAVVVDVSAAPRRPPELAPGAPWLPVAHRGLPDALWIPGAGADSVDVDVDRFYRLRLGQATSGNLDVPVVVYCHEKCWLSWNAAKRAIGYGYRRVKWFTDGIEGWTAAGYATAMLEPLGPGAGADAPPEVPAVAAVRPKLVVLDLELSGDLGGPEFAAEHDARLRTESARLRNDLEGTGLYEVLDNAPAQAAIDHLKGQQEFLHDCNGCDLDIGRQLQADLVMVSWVNRVSGLILTLTYELHDVKTSQITARKSYDFRGDNDNTWNHAIDYMVRDLVRDSKKCSNNC